MNDIIDFKKVLVERLSGVHNTSSFDCGDEDINGFIKNDALRWQTHKIAVTYVFIHEEEIIGLLCFSGDAIRLKHTEKGELEEKPIPEFPALKIGRLGRHKKYRGNNVGKDMLARALYFARKMSEDIGIRFITVDSYPDKVRWYESFGFCPNLHEHYDKKENVSMRMDLYNGGE